MNRPWLKIALRFVGVVLVVGAAIVFLRGGLSFRTETQTSADTYQIHHMLILPSSAAFPAALGVLILISSLLLPSKKLDGHRKT